MSAGPGAGTRDKRLVALPTDSRLLSCGGDHCVTSVQYIDDHMLSISGISDLSECLRP